MDLNVRRATTDDAPLLAEHRAAVWCEVAGYGTSELAPQIPVWATFFRECLTDATCVAFVVEERGVILGSAALLIHLAIPRPRFDSQRAGRVQSVYVVPAARRRGVARSLMNDLIAHAREAHLISLSLHPSEEARPLYVALGFEDADEMQLRLY